MRQGKHLNGRYFALTDEVGKIKLEHVLNHANNIRQVRLASTCKRHPSHQRLRQLS